MKQIHSLTMKKRKKVLIFDESATGHHLEYAHHFYEAAGSYDDMELVFVIPDKFNSIKGNFIWNERTNVAFDFLSEQEALEVRASGYIKGRWNRCRILRKYILKHHVDEVFLITAIIQSPFLPFFIPKGVKVSGIIYRLYVYECDNLSFSKKCKDYIETWALAKSSKVKTLFALNDESAACYYNRIFEVDKFQELVDPVVPLTMTPCSIRENLNVGQDMQMFLHFGMMTRRKGSLLILQALLQVPEDFLKNKVFVFAGCVDAEIRNEFYELKELLDKKVKILLYDRFCEYELLANLCMSTDYILTPYENVSSSSGVIGYASQFGKCVVGPGKGLLGKLIKRNKLGEVITPFTAEGLAAFIQKAVGGKAYRSDYMKRNCVDGFTQSIFKRLQEE